jgi:hypothetical protein
VPALTFASVLTALAGVVVLQAFADRPVSA